MIDTGVSKTWENQIPSPGRNVKSIYNTLNLIYPQVLDTHAKKDFFPLLKFLNCYLVVTLINQILAAILIITINLNNLIIQKEVQNKL